ncbi:MAG TPA: ornithine cyclodeaminase family protein [Roseiflexaceae bacterium]|nr:ornithine cyclodeaminase family protein [Roseiflexaceae bacterium]
MPILILNHIEVEQLLPIAECVEVMAEALADLSAGRMHQPLRTIVRPPDAAGLMGLMPSYRAGERALYGLKAVCVFPGNTAKGKDAHQGSVMLFSAETGELLALLNASAITAIRTGAVSAVATRLLAREDAGDLAILGTGVQARSHLAALACVRPIRRARIASRSFEHAWAFAEAFRPRYPFPIEPVETAEAAVCGADLIVTATTAAEPIVLREWIAPGAHINAIGSSIPTARELDTATMAAAGLFVDRRESTLNESGDYLFAMRAGAIGPDHIRAEVGELLLGKHAGRSGPDEITVFKSLGLAVEDLAAADYVYRQAQTRGVGTWVEF